MALMENYQQADGRIEIPEVLRPYARPRIYRLNFSLLLLKRLRALFTPLLIPGNNPCRECSDTPFGLNQHKTNNIAKHYIYIYITLVSLL